MHRKTQLLQFPKINDRCSAEVTIASELAQVTGSFKFRAAYNVVSSIQAPGFLAASSGNFGQALAKACQQLGKACIVVMPTTSAKVKIAAVQGFGATVDLVDTALKSRAARVAELAEQNPEFYVASAYDCPYVIEGNSTLGLELAPLAQNMDLVMVPIGGGGLSSGVISGLCLMSVKTPVWGAEPALGDDACRSLEAGQLLSNPTEPQTIADGARTVSLGRQNWQIISTSMKHALRVSEDNIRRALALYAQCDLRVEPTGALTLGALLEHPKLFEQRKIIIIISGGNVDQEVWEQQVSLGQSLL